jgi:hypothetical protein
MKNIIFTLLLTFTIVNLMLLVIALTDQSSVLNNYRLIIAISFMMFGGFLRQHLLGRYKISKK